MPEKLSGFAEDNLQNRIEDSRQQEINDLLTQRQEFIASGIAKDDESVKALNQRLLELTSPEGVDKFGTVEDLVEKSAMVYDRKEVSTDQENNLSEGMKFVKAEMKKIIDLRRSLITEVIPQITDQRAQSVIKGEVNKFDNDYLVFQQDVDWFDDKDDLKKVQDKFAGAFADWYDRLHDIFTEAHRNIDHN